MADKPRRYPGAGPFSEAQASLFCGRDADLKRLLQLLARQKQVLIYAKSGVGKSSLINAGLIPALETEGRRSIKVRFYPHTGGTMPPLARVLQAMPAVPADSYLRNIFPDHDGLWLRFKAQQALRPDALLLVFDQFEELFSYPPEQIQAFKQEMAELLHEALPERYQPILDEVEALEDAIYTQLYAPLDLQLVAAIREDKLSYIHQLSDALPELRHNYFELKPLSSTQAREAIVNPANTQGDFASPRFTIEDDAVQAILAELTKGEKPVEPTLLQIVCQQLESDIIAQPGKGNIQARDLPKFQDILKDFYLGVIGRIPAETQVPTRKFIEGELIQEGVRVPVAEQKCIALLGRPTLQALANVHLIRAEHNSTGGLSYELSHDILFEPISELRVLREMEEMERARVQEEQRLREELEREQAARERERRSLRRTRWALVGAVFGIVVAMLAMTFAFYQRSHALEKEREATLQRDSARVARDSAEVARRQAEKALQNLLESEEQKRGMKVDQMLRDAMNFRLFNQLDLAIEKLEQAVKLDGSRVDLKVLLEEYQAEFERRNPLKKRG